MSQLRRPPASVTSQRRMGTGVYQATVVSHLDTTFMGSLEVTLMKDQGNLLGDENQTFIVRYASPFSGSTAYEFMGKNIEDYDDTQKSYGWWAVPPDVGVNVLVCFIDGDPSEGYWFACLPGRYANHMIPAIGSSDKVAISQEDKRKYDVGFLPVAEINRRANSVSQTQKIDDIKKPVHPIADRFLEQGLLEDDVRGITTSSARREAPSLVFGISTPGPVDRRDGSKRARIGVLQKQTENHVPVSRLGGSQFVMDDGDDRYQRKKPAGELGLKDLPYVDTETGKKGDPTIPYNEHIRLRTRTGHQILLHNSEDLIYIGNAKGTSWIELSSNGKIDIYSKDSISVHTETDINFKADRDINIEAGRNINIKTTAEYQDAETLHSDKKITDQNGSESGRIQIESAFNFNLLIGANGKIQTKAYKDIDNNDQLGNFDIKVKGNSLYEVRYKDPTNVKTDSLRATVVPGLHIHSEENLRATVLKKTDIVIDQDLQLLVEGTTDIRSTGDLFVLTDSNLDIVSELNSKWSIGGTTDVYSIGDVKITTEGTTDLLSGGNIKITGGPRIDLNPSSPAAEAELATKSAVANKAEIARAIENLKIYILPKVNDNKAWKDRYKDNDVVSILTRMPMHEPWPHHENFAPDIFDKANIDREKDIEYLEQDRETYLIPEVVRKTAFEKDR